MDGTYMMVASFLIDGRNVLNALAVVKYDLLLYFLDNYCKYKFSINTVVVISRTERKGKTINYCIVATCAVQTQH